MKHHTLKQGAHAFCPPDLRLQYRPGFVGWEVYFPDEAIYLLPDDEQADLNKGGGLNFTPWRPSNQGETVMWAWRWNPKVSRFQLTAYYHLGGKTIKGPDGKASIMGEVKPFERFLVWIDVDHDARRYGVSFLLKGNLSPVTSTKKYSHTRKLCRRVSPWFGGTLPAPQALGFYRRELRREDIRFFNP